MFSIPHTIAVPPEYEIETDVPSVAVFVTCTLDGRLWVFRRSRRYYIAVFRWDEDTQRLVFVSTIILNDETIIKRGVDWILTDKSFILSSDSEPYISRITYESDDTTYIDSINQSYSFFTEFETWKEIFIRQIIKTNNVPFSNTLNEGCLEIPQSAIVPLEFHYYSDNDIQAVTDFMPKLCYCNGQLYGKGKAHIGRAYLLPYIFDTNGVPIDFYLYISPDYLRHYDTDNQTFDDNDGWADFLITPLNQEAACFFIPERNDSTFCKKAKNGQVFILPQNEQLECKQLDFSVNNGAIFFDGFTGSNLMLNNNGAFWLCDNLSYECKGLHQWLVPSNIAMTISSQNIMSDFDNETLSIYIQQGFYRELLMNKILIFTIREYSRQTLFMGEKNIEGKRNICINQKTAISFPAKYSDWSKTFRSAVHFSPLREIESHAPYYPARFQVDEVPLNFFIEVPSSIEDTWSYYAGINIHDDVNCLFDIHDSYIGDNEKTFIVMGAVWLSPYPISVFLDWDYDEMEAWGVSVASYKNITISYIDPHTMELVQVHKVFNWRDFCSGLINIEDGLAEQTLLFPNTVIVKNNQIQLVGLLCNLTVPVNISGSRRSVYKINSSNRIYIPIFDIPEEILKWQSTACGLHVKKVTDFKEINCAEFSEPYTKLTFAQIIPSGCLTTYRHSRYLSISIAPRSQTFHNVESMQDISISQDSICTHSLHIVGCYRRFCIMQSELHPEIFDFKSEAERSKLS